MPLPHRKLPFALSEMCSVALLLLCVEKMLLRSSRGCWHNRMEEQPVPMDNGYCQGDCRKAIRFYWSRAFPTRTDLADIYLAGCDELKRMFQPIALIRYCTPY